jgi:hypothetical protein
MKHFYEEFEVNTKVYDLPAKLITIAQGFSEVRDITPVSLKNEVYEVYGFEFVLTTGQKMFLFTDSNAHFETVCHHVDKWFKVTSRVRYVSQSDSFIEISDNGCVLTPNNK